MYTFFLICFSMRWVDDQGWFSDKGFADESRGKILFYQLSPCNVPFIDKYFGYHGALIILKYSLVWYMCKIGSKIQNTISSTTEWIRAIWLCGDDAILQFYNPLPFSCDINALCVFHRYKLNSRNKMVCSIKEDARGVIFFIILGTKYRLGMSPN